MHAQVSESIKKTADFPCGKSAVANVCYQGAESTLVYLF